VSSEIRMPRLTDSMTQGAVVAWRKKQGEPVRAGEVIAEIEVDKATVDLESPEAGTLARIVVPAGSGKIDVGQVLAVLKASEAPALAIGQQPAASASIAPNCDKRLPRAAPAARSDPNSAWSSAVTLPARSDDVPASPLARSMARQAGVDLSALHGGGPGGRVVQADVLKALGSHDGSEVAKTPGPIGLSQPGLTHSAGPYEDILHSRIRQVMAQRLGESKRTIPHFYLEVNCRVDALLQLRAELQAGQNVPRLSLNDFAIRAAALALRKVPEANACWTDAATRRFQRIDLAFAVATEAGLVAPVVRDADRKGLTELAAEVRDLVGRARLGRLRPEELEGGTFTLTNLGMYGIDALYAIINPPQAGILGLGAAEPRPVAVAGSVVVATMLTCTLSADHRALDGATAARFLNVFKRLLEQPMMMSL
jgi:pyruvate dehydrogenase E2 component (dihydrolipoamide acetyltransferase)